MLTFFSRHRDHLKEGGRGEKHNANLTLGVPLVTVVTGVALGAGAGQLWLEVERLGEAARDEGLDERRPR